MPSTMTQDERERLRAEFLRQASEGFDRMLDPNRQAVGRSGAAGATMFPFCEERACLAHPREPSRGHAASPGDLNPLTPDAGPVADS